MKEFHARNLSGPAALQGHRQSAALWNPDHLGFYLKKKKTVIYILATIAY